MSQQSSSFSSPWLDESNNPILFKLLYHRQIYFIPTIICILLYQILAIIPTPLKLFNGFICKKALQQEITFEELNKTRRVIEENHLQSGHAIASLQTDNALASQAITALQADRGRMVKMEAMLETLIAHIARDPSSSTQL